MRASAVAGIVFANTNDTHLKKLTETRSMAAVPFAARYRVIDFPLSALVNAGVSSVGIITKENYRSLMDHIGSGVAWDLDRKNGGIFLLPPYVTSDVKRYNGTVDALHGALDYIKRCNAEYMVLCNSDMIANVDIGSAVAQHVKTEADITVVYHYGDCPKMSGDFLVLKTAQDGRITEMKNVDQIEGKAEYYLGVTVVSRALLLKMVEEAFAEGQMRFATEVIAGKIPTMKVYGFEHKGFASILDSTDAYFKANMAVLESDVRKSLFTRERPVFTKTRDDMPTRYGTRSKVSNCVIADGCVINGTVSNSIVSRGVRVEKGAVVENCILMQGSVVKANAVLKYVVTDKNATVGENMLMKGTSDKRLLIEKNQTV